MDTKHYIYDFEIFPNYIGCTFIPENCPQEYIDIYKKIDNEILIIKHNNVNLEKIHELEIDKKELLKLMKVQQFRIWKNYHGKGFINDINLFMDFVRSYKIITGYNSYNYDSTMFDILINNARFVDSQGWHTKEKCTFVDYMYQHSVNCIGYKKGYGRALDYGKYYKRPFKDYDIQKILYLDKSFTSLKQVAICLKWYRIQDLPLPYNKPIEEHELEAVEDYNVNDVLITLALKRNQRSEIILREELSKEFNIDFRNMSRSSIGKAITTDLYSKAAQIDKRYFEDRRTYRSKVSLGKIISDEIKFKTPVLCNLLNNLKKEVISIGGDNKASSFGHTVKLNGKLYTMALGGLHSKDNPIIYDYTNEYIYRDADVKNL